MSRPEDIPEDVWLAAYVASQTISGMYLDEMGRDLLQLKVARAILAERSAQRERDAVIAEQEQLTGTPPSDWSLEHILIVQGTCRATAKSIAAAIRQNANPKPANSNFGTVPHQGEIR